MYEVECNSNMISANMAYFTYALIFEICTYISTRGNHYQKSIFNGAGSNSK